MPFINFGEFFIIQDSNKIIFKWLLHNGPLSMGYADSRSRFLCRSTSSDKKVQTFPFYDFHSGPEFLDSDLIPRLLFRHLQNCWWFCWPSKMTRPQNPEKNWMMEIQSVSQQMKFQLKILNETSLLTGNQVIIKCLNLFKIFIHSVFHDFWAPNRKVLTSALSELDTCWDMLSCLSSKHIVAFESDWSLILKIQGRFKKILDTCLLTQQEKSCLLDSKIRSR